MASVIAQSHPRTPVLGKPIWLLTGCTLSIVVALVALMNGVSEGWSISLIGVFPASILVVYAIRGAIEKTRNLDFFSPLVAFPILYVVWFTIGSIDFIHVSGSVSFGLFEPIPAYVLGYAALGLLAYMAGALLASRKNIRLEPCSKIEFNWLENRFWVVVSVLTALMFASFAYIVAGMGVIPALVADAGEVRLKIRNYGPEEAVLFTAAWSLIPMLMMYVWLKRPKRVVKLACYAIVSLTGALLLLLGGRAQLFIPLLATLVVRHYCRRRLRAIRLFAVGVVIFCGLSLFGYIRDSAMNGGASLGSNLGIPSSITPFAYAYLYIRYPVATLRDVITTIPSRIPYQWGALTFGPLGTLLPGHHEQSDMYFKDMLGNDFIGAGQPATLLGPLYADAGLFGILLGMFLFALLITRTYAWTQASPSVFRVLLYAWLVQTLLLSLFSNLFPYLTTIWLPAFWGIAHLFLQKPNASDIMP